jgi:hypothetical protein
VAVAQNLSIRVYSKQTFFRGRQVIFAAQEVAGQRHGVAIAQVTARDEWIENRVFWIFSHAVEMNSFEFAYNNDAVIF